MATVESLGRTARRTDDSDGSRIRPRSDARISARTPGSRGETSMTEPFGAQGGASPVSCPAIEPIGDFDESMFEAAARTRGRAPMLRRLAAQMGAVDRRAIRVARSPRTAAGASGGGSQLRRDAPRSSSRAPIGALGLRGQQHPAGELFEIGFEPRMGRDVRERHEQKLELDGREEPSHFSPRSSARA